MSLTSKQQAVLQHLLAGKCITTAAKAASVNPATVHRWQAQPEFAAALADGQDRLFRSAVDLLRARVSGAVEVLDKEMREAGSPASARVSAADKLLCHALRFADALELADKIDALQAEVDALKQAAPAPATPFARRAR